MNLSSNYSQIKNKINTSNVQNPQSKKYNYSQMEESEVKIEKIKNSALVDKNLAI